MAKGKFSIIVFLFSPSSCQFYSPHTHEFSMETEKEKVLPSVFCLNNKCERSFRLRENSQRFTSNEMKNDDEKEKKIFQ